MTVLPTFVLVHHAIPRQPGSKDNFGPYVNVVTWILLITSTLAVLTRLITKRALRRRIDVDDAFVIAALVCITPGLRQSLLPLADECGR
jgi:heme/copper-type cytochrome/quinol oxidase subunit 1